MDTFQTIMIFKHNLNYKLLLKELGSHGYTWEAVNHSQEFVRQDNKAIHTQTIEGRWFCVKRWLPSSGRYDLHMYLPVYLWTVDCKKRGVNMFWELLKLISMCEGEKMLNLVTLKEKPTPTEPRYPCLYCGRDLSQRKLRKHIRKCKSK